MDNIQLQTVITEYNSAKTYIIETLGPLVCNRATAVMAKKNIWGMWIKQSDGSLTPGYQSFKVSNVDVINDKIYFKLSNTTFNFGDMRDDSDRISEWVFYVSDFNDLMAFTKKSASMIKEATDTLYAKEAEGEIKRKQYKKVSLRQAILEDLELAKEVYAEISKEVK